MSTRLYSLDVLRGLDMFLQTVIGPLVTAHMSARLFPKSVLFAVALLGCGFAVGDEAFDPKADPRACVAQILKRQMRRYSKFSNVPASFFDFAEMGGALDSDPSEILPLLDRYDVARGAFAKEFARLKPFFEPAAVKKLAAWTGFE